MKALARYPSVGELGYALEDPSVDLGIDRDRPVALVYEDDLDAMLAVCTGGAQLGPWREVDPSDDPDIGEFGDDYSPEGRSFTRSTTATWPRVHITAFHRAPIENAVHDPLRIGGVSLSVSYKKKPGHHCQVCDIPPELVPVAIEALTKAAKEPAE